MAETLDVLKFTKLNKWYNLKLLIHNYYNFEEKWSFQVFHFSSIGFVYIVLSPIP